jgi:hypothetical protein
LVFPDGTYTSDPLSHETTDEAIKNLRTVLDPALHGPQDYSMDQPVFDARSSRWLPVPRTAVSPDGSRYAYSQYLYPSNPPVSPPPAPIESLIRLVTIATGDDRVIYRGVPYQVVGWKPEGVYLRRPCTDAYCFASNAVIAEHLAGQWIGLNGTFPPSIDDPANLSKTADCVLGRHGSATVKGAATIAGVPTVEVDDVGDVPGSFPGKFYFAVATGDLVQVSATGPVHPGGMDAICTGGLSLNPGSVAEMGTYLFDGWRSHFVATAPSSAINLDDAPFCGSPLGQQLSQAAQQYLAASFEWNRAMVVVAASCGCNSNATYSEFRAAVLQEVAANELYAVAMGRLAVTGKALADARALVADMHTEDQVFRAAAATPGFATYNAYTTAIGQARNRAGAAASILRSDLGLGDSTCSYVIP